MGIDKFNHEGYLDPTTYGTLTNIHREEMAADKKAAYLPLVYVCSSCGIGTCNNSTVFIGNCKTSHVYS